LPVHVGPSGRRSASVEVQVPGPAVRVWDAIATPEGLSSWFVPTTFALNPNGRPKQITFAFTPNHTDTVTIITWHPPRRFVVLSPNFIPNGPSVTTEWTVSDICDGTCVVRVEHQLAADTEEWDVYLKDAESGWPAFFDNLTIYLEEQ
jgi:uncharacterized protein YndB with AHSA1/START domain